MNNKDLSVNQRIKFLIDEYSTLTQRAFAEKIGVSQSAISSLFSQRENRPGLEMLQKIAIAYPELSLDWLVMGQGEMLRGQTHSPSPPAGELAQLTQNYMQLSKQLEGQKATYREAANDLAQLRAEVQHHEAALNVQMEHLPNFSQEGQELLRAVIQQQQESLAHARERYAAFLPLHEQAESDLLKTHKRHAEIDARISSILFPD